MPQMPPLTMIKGSYSLELLVLFLLVCHVYKIKYRKNRGNEIYKLYIDTRVFNNREPVTLNINIDALCKIF